MSKKLTWFWNCCFVNPTVNFKAYHYAFCIISIPWWLQKCYTQAWRNVQMNKLDLLARNIFTWYESIGVCIWFEWKYVIFTTFDEWNFCTFYFLCRKSSVEDKQEAKDRIENPKLLTSSPSQNQTGKSRNTSNIVELTFLIWWLTYNIKRNVELLGRK